MRVGHSQVMRSRTSIALLSLLAASACREASSPQPEYRPAEAGTVDHAMCLLGFQAVPLREVTTGHHLVQASINGRTGSFVLDTGANASVLDASHVQHFGLAGTGGIGGIAGGIGGARRANQVPVESFEIGSVDVRQQRIVTAEIGQLLETLGRLSGTTVYGLVGQDVLKEHRAIVDVARPMLYLMAEDEDPSPVPPGQCDDSRAAG